MTNRKFLINRAPVLTLWASVVAERLGFNKDEALSLGKGVAGLTAQSKGRRLGIYKPVPLEIKKARAKKLTEEFLVEVCGRPGQRSTRRLGCALSIKGSPSNRNPWRGTWLASSAMRSSRSPGDARVSKGLQAGATGGDRV